MGSFDAVVWKAQHGKDEAHDNPRQGMVGALLKDVLKAGMSRGEVTKLLGPPEFQRNNNDYYGLGRAAYGIDDEYLVVHYEHDRMTLARLERS